MQIKLTTNEFKASGFDVSRANILQRQLQAAAPELCVTIIKRTKGHIIEIKNPDVQGTTRYIQEVLS